MFYRRIKEYLEQREKEEKKKLEELKGKEEMKKKLQERMEADFISQLVCVNVLFGHFLVLCVEVDQYPETEIKRTNGLKIHHCTFKTHKIKRLGTLNCLISR